MHVRQHAQIRFLSLRVVLCLPGARKGKSAAAGTLPRVLRTPTPSRSTGIIKETLIKYRTVRCVRGGWMQADRRSAGWTLRKEGRAADAAPDATRQYESAFEGPALLAQ